MSFEPLYTADEMRAAEEGHDVEELMQRAGRAVAEHAMARFPDARRFALLCGGGANGGDARVAGEVLRAEGREAEETDDLARADVVLDGLFGTGFRGEPRDEAAARIAAVAASGARVVAVDIPSGVDASTGEVRGAAVRADLTVTFHGWKVGHEVAPGRFHCGDVVLADLGLLHVATEHKLVVPPILRLVPRRGPADSKYTAGSVLVVGGAPGLTGAACLAAEAAFRADAGYVAVAVPERSLPVVETRLLETVKVGWPPGGALDAVRTAAAKADALALGPGLGRDDEARLLVRTLLAETDLPAVVDADALHGLEPLDRAAPTVLTPHEGELARLLGEDSATIRARRLDAVRRAADAFGATVLLKGADTLVAAPGAGVLVRRNDAPGLATAGTGDVLTGVLAAFLAKGLAPDLAAAAAATAHGIAAARAPQQDGLVAGDVVALLPEALALNR